MRVTTSGDNVSLNISDQIRAEAAKVQQNSIGYIILAAIVASLCFFLTGYVQISRESSYMKGLLENTDKTVETLLQERNDVFQVLLQSNSDLMKENLDLRKEIDDLKYD